MKEYIVSVDDDDMDYEEVFIGYIKRQKELIRCKDCRHWTCDDDESYCDELGIFGTNMNSYCSYAKRKEYEIN